MPCVGKDKIKMKYYIVGSAAVYASATRAV
jgi:hypothetical protein